MLNRTSRTVEPTKEKSVAEKQAEEIEEAKEVRAQFVRKGTFLLRFNVFLLFHAFFFEINRQIFNFFLK